MIEFIAGVMVGLLLPIIYGTWLWHKESKKLKSNTGEKDPQ